MAGGFCYRLTLARKFLNASEYPMLRLRGSVAAEDGGSANIDASIEIRGICMPVHLTATTRQPRGSGSDRRAFVLRGAINRTDFGIEYSRVVIGEEVELVLDVELIRVRGPG